MEKEYKYTELKEGVEYSYNGGGRFELRNGLLWNVNANRWANYSCIELMCARFTETPIKLVSFEEAVEWMSEDNCAEFRGETYAYDNNGMYCRRNIPRNYNGNDLFYAEMLKPEWILLNKKA